ncbi:hypothetical protein BH23VER1_BH23VER1_31540 [soil metagenome]
MLALHDISYLVPDDDQGSPILDEATFRVGQSHFMAIVGPSGCGKTTLLKVIAGLLQESSGTVTWEGRDLSAEEDLSPSEVGYVPQFGIAYDHLTVEESVRSALRLRVSRASMEVPPHEMVDQLLEHVGLESIRHSRVKVISGGQRRRLALAMELVTDPVLLLCDEVTSGLDPKSEHDILTLLHSLSQEHGRIVINVTHSLAHLELYDSVLVMEGGRIAYHGPPKALGHYFSVEAAEDIYPKLGQRPAERWHQSWCKYRESYYQAFQAFAPASTAGPDEGGSAAPEEVDLPSAEGSPYGQIHIDNPPSIGIRKPQVSEDEPPGGPPLTPGALTQTLVLMARRWKLFFRDRTQLILHLAILFGFPLLVVIFALDGLEPMPKRLAFSEVASARDFARQAAIVEKQVGIGALISGLVMFQVILLTLMGANNAAREIAAERLIFEKEKFAGLRPSSYVASKVGFLGILVLVQSFWMTAFVRLFCTLPGDATTQFTLLLLVNAAMTAVCLGLSALVRTAEQGSLLGIYLVGFQLPLSGAILALPSAVESLTRPFIAAYWSWAGQLQSMVRSDYFVGIKEAAATSLGGSASTATFVLFCHVLLGIVAAFLGTRQNRWE